MTYLKEVADSSPEKLRQSHPHDLRALRSNQNERVLSHRRHQPRIDLRRNRSQSEISRHIRAGTVSFDRYSTSTEKSSTSETCTKRSTISGKSWESTTNSFRGSQASRKPQQRTMPSSSRQLSKRRKTASQKRSMRTLLCCRAWQETSSAKAALTKATTREITTRTQTSTRPKLPEASGHRENPKAPQHLRQKRSRSTTSPLPKASCSSRQTKRSSRLKPPTKNLSIESMKSRRTLSPSTEKNPKTTPSSEIKNKIAPEASFQEAQTLSKEAKWSPQKSCSALTRHLWQRTTNQIPRTSASSSPNLKILKAAETSLRMAQTRTNSTAKSAEVRTVSAATAASKSQSRREKKRSKSKHKSLTKSSLNPRWQSRNRFSWPPKKTPSTSTTLNSQIR